MKPSERIEYIISMMRDLGKIKIDDVSASIFMDEYETLYKELEFWKNILHQNNDRQCTKHVANLFPEKLQANKHIIIN